MRPGVTLNGSDVREIIAKFLEVPLEAVTPMKFSFVVYGLSADEIKERIGKGE